MPQQESFTVKNSTPSFTTSFDSSFPSNVATSGGFNNASLFSQQPPTSNKGASMNFGFGGSNDDPFAEVEHQYGISPINANTNPSVSGNLATNNNANFNFGNVNTNNNNSKPKPKSNDPFDDLL